MLQLSALRATLVPPHDQGTGWALRHGEAFSMLVRPTVNPVRQATLENTDHLEHQPGGVRRPRLATCLSAFSAPAPPCCDRRPSGCEHRLHAATARLHAASLRPHQARSHRSPQRSPRRALAHAAPSPCAPGALELRERADGHLAARAQPERRALRGGDGPCAALGSNTEPVASSLEPEPQPQPQPQPQPEPKPKPKPKPKPNLTLRLRLSLSLSRCRRLDASRPATLLTRASPALHGAQLFPCYPCYPPCSRCTGLHGFAQGCALFSWGNDWSVVQAHPNPNPNPNPNPRHDLLQQSPYPRSSRHRSPNPDPNPQPPAPNA